MRIIGLIITIALITLAMGDITAFIDIPSLLIVLGGTLGMLIFGCSSIPNMVSAVFSGDATNEQLTAAAKGWRMARSYTLAFGVIGTFIGGVIMLKNMDDPAAIGPGVALAILTILYALLLSFAVYLPLQSRLEDRIQ